MGAEYKSLASRSVLRYLPFGGWYRLNSGHFGCVASRAPLPSSWLPVSHRELSVELCGARLEGLCAQVSPEAFQESRILWVEEARPL